MKPSLPNRTPLLELDLAVERILSETWLTAIEPCFRRLKPEHIVEKDAGDYVTAADLAAETYLRGRLAALLPEAGFLGEEEVGRRILDENSIGPGATWIVDPLDGTGNFVAGRMPIAIMVGLLLDGETIGAWIYLPDRNVSCRAKRGSGTFIDGRRVELPPRSTEVSVEISHRLEQSRARARSLQAAGSRYVFNPIPNCAGEQYARLLLGETDVALFARSLPWDHLPGALLVTEAGGLAARPDGSRYRVGDGKKGLIVARSATIWQAARRDILCPEDLG